MTRENLFSVPASGFEKRSNETTPRVNGRVGVYEQPYDDRRLNNVYDIFLNGLGFRPDKAFVGWRTRKSDGSAGPFRYHTYRETQEYALAVGDALHKLDVQPTERVAIYGVNSPNVTIVDLACATQNFVVVPLYDSLGADSIRYVLNHAKVKVVFVQDTKLQNIVDVRAQCPSVETVVVMGTQDVFSVGGFEPRTDVQTLKELYAGGSAGEATVRSGAFDDMAMIMYTSGTTSDPKGVVLRNGQFVAAVGVVVRFVNAYGIVVSHEDSLLSFLPLAHVFGQVLEKALLMIGCSIGYWQGNVKLLLDDLMELQPTIFCAVPAVYGRIEQSIRDVIDAQGPIRKALFWGAFRVQLGNLNAFRTRNQWLDRLIFGRVKAKLLPKVRFCVTGAAPMSPSTNDFLKVVLMVPVLQGYGLTETCSVTSCSAPHAPNTPEISASGNVGGPMNGYVKLVDVPDMDYFVTDKPYPRGEVVVSGPTTFDAYYADEQETAQAFTPDGWFRTGDIGQLLPDGCFQIVDRRKNLFKLAQGEYVSPEKLEMEYMKARLISQIWVYGNSLQRSLVAIVVPDAEQWRQWAKENRQAADASLEQLSQLPELKSAILQQLEQQRVEARFNKYEGVSDVRYMLELDHMGLGFTVENDLLTPTLKKKRVALQRRFQGQLDEMYGAKAGSQ